MSDSRMLFKFQSALLKYVEMFGATVYEAMQALKLVSE